MGNLKNYNFNKLDAYLSNSEYYDYYLAQDEYTTPGIFSGVVDDCLAVHYDFNNQDIFISGHPYSSVYSYVYGYGNIDTIQSLVSWTGATNTGFTFTTFGLTGIDNGFITYNNTISDTSNTALTSTLTGTTTIINSGVTELILNRVTGSTTQSVEYITSGWTGVNWVISTGGTLSCLSAVFPAAPLTSTISQNLTLLADNQYLLSLDVTSLIGVIYILPNNPTLTQTITTTGHHELLIDLTGEPTINVFDIRLSGYSVINTTIENVSITQEVPTYVYPITLLSGTTSVGNYANFCGGFYQGFYKLDGYDYEVLPVRVPKAWVAEFWLRKSDNSCSGTTGTTLNDTYPNNKGFFFYMGTRAENKFWNIFEGNNTGCTSGCTVDSGCTGTVTTFCTIPKETDISLIDDNGHVIPLSPPPIQYTEVTNPFLIYGRASANSALCGNCGGPSGYGNQVACEYTGDSITISGYTGKKVNNPTNPFLIYGRASSSSTLCNNCGGPSGYGNQVACEYSGDTELLLELDKDADIIDNAIGFRIKDDGSIGYRLLTVTGQCSGNTYVSGVTIEEQYSASGMVSDDVWTKIDIRFVMPEYNETQLICGKQRKGRLMFYVNSKLKFVVDGVDEFIARRLNEHKDKQLGVPFNISLGGGSQGLLESMTFDGQDSEDLGLHIEENFAGTFIGDISQFRFNLCDLTWCEIKNNYGVERERYEN